jgi:transposase InsO family protein
MFGEWLRRERQGVVLPPASEAEPQWTDEEAVEPSDGEGLADQGLPGNSSAGAVGASDRAAGSHVATGAGASFQPPAEEAVPGASVPASSAGRVETVIDPGLAGAGADSFEAALSRVVGRTKGRRLAKPAEARQATFTPPQRLLILDSWLRSGLPAGDFAPLVGLSKHTLYSWKKRFDQQGPGGLVDHPRGARLGSKLPEVTKRTILLLKDAHPEWGVQRISDELVRGPALPASAAAVARVLHEAGYVLIDRPTDPHPEKVQHFERARPNQLWQTDLFTFVLKRQNRRVYLVAFLDDHSRFVVGYGLYGSASTALVLEVLRAGIASYGQPDEILTDNGPQYVTWRGQSQFSRELAKRGIRQIVSRPKHPQTLGKIERFWGTLWRECVEAAVFLDLEDARRRIGLFIDYYNFQRPHQGLEGLVPGDRFFGAAPTILGALQERVAANALELARQGVPKQPFYVAGQVAGQNFSLHAEGERMILTRAGQPREEVELVAPAELAPMAEEGPSASSLPEPVCPHGAPVGIEPPDSPSPGVAGWETASGPPAPGSSPGSDAPRGETAGGQA